MVKESITIQETVDFLNSLIKIDSSTITKLFDTRIHCNEAIANHETVQVINVGIHYFKVGMIGILNGLFGIDEYGWGHIIANYEDGKIISFEVLTSEKAVSFQTKEK